ncbi:hypothetical protein ITI46_08175 [Streptomyces oryzae]|uniref:Phytoene synthase n=1 Tax=Streptomyces oryzae TaxID=1434886 RepID=A0ABS3X8G8_9ACTN|nr:hypothetical protein [Streptomyces oryzae]MBO8191656.1 hypothetical protein [Streptomyces oryzae]
MSLTRKTKVRRPLLSRGERGAADRAWQRPLAAQPPMDWERTAVTLRHQLKAGAVTQYCVRTLQLLGCPRDALDYYWPPLLHLEALVYLGDLAVEREQSHGVPAGPAWRDGIEEVLRGYGCDDAATLAELRALEEYARWETEATGSRAAPGVGDLVRACHGRSSDVRIMLRFGRHLAGLPHSEAFDRLAGHLYAMGELTGDVVGYAADVADDSCNFYRMCVWSAGTEGARDRLGEIWQRLCADLRRDLAAADHRTLALVARVFLPRPRPLRALAVKRRPTRVHALLPRPLLRAYIWWRLERGERLRLPAVPEPVAESVAEPGKVTVPGQARARLAEEPSV